MTDLSITVTSSADPRIDHYVGRWLSDGVSMETGANIAHPISTVAELQPFLFVDDAVAMVGWRAASWPREHRHGSRTSDILICRGPGVGSVVQASIAQTGLGKTSEEDHCRL